MVDALIELNVHFPDSSPCGEQNFNYSFIHIQEAFEAARMIATDERFLSLLDINDLMKFMMFENFVLDDDGWIKSTRYEENGIVFEIKRRKIRYLDQED